MWVRVALNIDDIEDVIKNHIANLYSININAINEFSIRVDDDGRDSDGYVTSLVCLVDVWIEQEK